MLAGAFVVYLIIMQVQL